MCVKMSVNVNKHLVVCKTCANIGLTVRKLKGIDVKRVLGTDILSGSAIKSFYILSH